MTATSDRQTLSELAERSGWRRKQVDRTDFYRRGVRQLEVLFTEDTLNGGTLFEDLHLLTYTRDISTIQSWMTRAT
ncbi:MAG: hypothetical protein QOH57_437 [Mycobacterium sp.]|jgi:hypothetical protein|nr:hypothetical protein [Mycobacterium sp.]